MNKIKKIISSVLIGFISLLGFWTTANAYYVGQEISISFNEYTNNGNIYCVENHQALRGDNPYKIISEVKIEGNKSTDHTGYTQESWHNAKLAYILSADNGKDKDSGPVANSIWNYMYTWMQNIGKNHAGLYSGFANNSPGSSNWLDTESTNYANNLGDISEQIVDNTNKDNIKVVTYEKDGKSYMRVGPFNWTFSGKMENVTAYDQNEKAISGTLYSKFKGNEETWLLASEIQSGSDFYISVPVDAGVTKITKIAGNAKINVKGVNIWFLEATEGYKQNLIIREPYDAPMDIVTSFDYSIGIQGNLKIIKIAQDDETIKLAGVGFYIQQKETGKYIYQDANGNISYVEKEQATEFITDKNGEISIRNLIVGTYVAYETKNPNYGYEINTNGESKTIVAGDTTEWKIGNKQIYVKLSGYVWVDKIYGKQSVRNDLYQDADYDMNDILLDGITVRLKDKTTGETVKETVTSQLNLYTEDGNNGNGEYLFEDVLIEKLGDYYIEFEYDGLTYTNVVPHIDKNNGSKSAESEEERTAFNQKFSAVEGESRNTGFTRDANGNKVYNLSYNIDETGHKATLINNGQYIITANTDVPQYSIKEHFNYGEEVVRYINLGLCEREKPDIALLKDLQNVRLTINGYEHTYNYAQRFVNAGEYGDGFNVGVKFGSKYGSMSYSRAIYKADYEYINENDKSKELKVYVTYQIKMRNESSNLTAQVNSIVDYFDKKYQIVNAGTSLDEKGNVVGDISYTQSDYNESYTKGIINNATRIQAQQEESIYVQFVLNREAVINILNDRENLDNVVEINSYSIYDGDKIYAGIDVDSNPGNCVPGNPNTYEDDTDVSPALKLEVADARELTGKVFLDSTSNELMTGKVRQGSGVYEEGEKGIEGVEVTFTENTGSGKVYTATTDENGDFFISDYIPGDYTLTYTWGDETYTVQNYKGTIYDCTRDQNNKEWYKENVETRLNDAMDNYQTRQEIDNEMKNIKNGTQITIHKMDSTTPTMGIGVEYETTYTASTGDKYTYQISNVDFGIVERARQDIALTKRVKTMKVTLANGQVIVDLTIDENGNITGEKDHITYMKPDQSMTPSNGYIKLELDNELIQGANLEVGYEIKVTNNSEIDYLSEKFYHYGIVEGDVVTIESTAILDYLDKDWAFDSAANAQWTVKALDEIKNLVVEEVYNNPETTIEEKIILYTESLKGQNLKPTESAEVMLNVSKILTTTDEISLDNETEIVEVNKPGGSNLQSTPGNYVPGTEGQTENDNSTAETVIVTPSTGENQNYIMPILIGVVALVILGAGVVIIKKKVI